MNVQVTHDLLFAKGQINQSLLKLGHIEHT
jgi:hypothetical protein